VQCSASCWLLTISMIAIVIQPIKSSANPSHHLMGVGGGGRGGEIKEKTKRNIAFAPLGSRLSTENGNFACLGGKRAPRSDFFAKC